MSAPFVAIVGTVNRDVIRTEGGRTHESLGGILYNALSLGAVLEGTGFRVRPVGRLGDADRARAVRLADSFPAVDATTLIADAAGTNSCVLEYDSAGNRAEEVHLRVAPLSEADLAPIAGARAVLVNMISGRDVPCDVFARAREGQRGLYLLDIQALARTLESPRRPRRVSDWRAWSALFDVVRGNELEIAHFADEPSDPAAAAAAILAVGPSEVIATRGLDGCTRYWWDGDLRSESYAAFPARGDAPDSTGCGDAFLAGVCAARVLGLREALAPLLGAWVASEVAGVSGIESLAALRGVRARARAGDARFIVLPA